MRISAVHRVPPLLSLCTFVIEVFLSVLRGPFGTSIFMEETVLIAVYMQHYRINACAPCYVN